MRERGIDQNAAAQQMPHRIGTVYFLDWRRKIPLDKRHDPKAEHPLGRLNLVGAISDLQYDAGCRFRNEVMRYRRVLDIRKDAQSIAGFGQPQPPTPKELDDEQATRIKREYMEAFAAIGSHEAQSAVKHVVVLELELDPLLFEHLDFGLGNLVKHYELT